MRAMWREFGRAQTPALAPARPYTLADLRRVLGEVTRDTAFANDFFRRYVQGHEVVDYQRLLANGGFLLRKAHAGQPWLGAQLVAGDDSSVVVAAPAIQGSSLYNAGIDRLDRVYAIDGTRTATPEAIRTALAGHRAGETVRMDVAQRGTRREIGVTLVENPEMEVVTYESAGMPVTGAMRAFRQSWLGSRAGAR